MLYILRMNIKENSSNNHKSTFRIKNFFKKENQNHNKLSKGDFFTDNSDLIRKLRRRKDKGWTSENVTLLFGVFLLPLLTCL